MMREVAGWIHRDQSVIGCRSARNRLAVMAAPAEKAHQVCAVGQQACIIPCTIGKAGRVGVLQDCKAVIS
jgi:hypothetical protein